MAFVPGNSTSSSSAIANEPGLKASADSMRAVRVATDLSGAVDTAIIWFENERLSAFAFKTAEQLVSEGRIEDVLRYLASLEAGTAG